MLRNIVISGILLSTTLCQYTYRYISDEATEADKNKVKVLAKELIVESKYKINQVDVVRNQLASEIGFQVGTIIGYIREKYKTMLEIYRLDSNKHSGKSRIVLPRIPLVRPIHYLLRMELVSSLEVEIDRMVHILESIPNDSLGIFYNPKYRRARSNNLDSNELSNYRTELFKKLQLFP